MDEKHFLCWRDKTGPRKIEVFLDQGEALAAYREAEEEVGLFGWAGLNRGEKDVCLFGSDSLATLCKTHASWFAPETLSLDVLEAQVNA